VVAYLFASLTVSHLKGWSVGFWLLVLFASIIPFACFFLDRKLREQGDMIEGEFSEAAES
jgi:hypothetical protein